MPTTFLKRYLEELRDIFNIVDPYEFESFIDELKKTLETNATVFICGNGGSASTASHFVCDINKGVSFGLDNRYKVICLSDNMPTVLAYANDLSYDDVFVEQLKNFMNRNDLVIGVSGSGDSENVLRAIQYANQNGARSFGICGYGGGRLKEEAWKSFVVSSSDMQKVEDMHLIFFHCAMQYLFQNNGR